MSIRKPGYYWIDWTHMADEELVARRPGPHVGWWDGSVWWFVRTDVYRFDCEVKVLDAIAAPPRTVSTAAPRQLRAVGA